MRQLSGRRRSCCRIVVVVVRIRDRCKIVGSIQCSCRLVQTIRDQVRWNSCPTWARTIPREDSIVFGLVPSHCVGRVSAWVTCCPDASRLQQSA